MKQLTLENEAAVVNNSTHKRYDTGSYRIPIAVQFAWALVLIIVSHTRAAVIANTAFGKTLKFENELSHMFFTSISLLMMDLE